MTAVLEHSFVHVPIGFKGVEASEEEIDVSVLKSALDRMQAEVKKKTFGKPLGGRILQIFCLL